MKKIIGWTLIILCSVFFLIIIAALIYLFPKMLSGNGETNMSIIEIISSLVGFLLTSLAMIVGIKVGVTKIKKKKIIEVLEYKKTLDIQLTGKIEYPEYRNLLLELSFKKPIFLVTLGITILLVLSVTVNIVSASSLSDINYFLYFICGIMLLSPVFTIINIKKTYKTTKIFHEQLNYHLTNESFTISGNTVDSTQKWTNFYQILETKKFFLLYHGEIVATLVEKKMFSSDELKEFQNFIKSLNLKK